MDCSIAELVPVNKRGMFLAVNTIITLPITPAVLYTELLSNGPSWRWCFWICVLVLLPFLHRPFTDTTPSIWNAMALLALLPTYCRLNIVRPSREQKVATFKSIDYIGMILLIIGSALL